MEDIRDRYFQINRHIADKILFLRRGLNLSQEEFAECIGADRRTITRAENGKYRPADKTLIAISKYFKLPISYFYDDSKYEITKEKTEIIDEINSKLNIATTDELVKINSLVSVLILTKK